MHIVGDNVGDIMLYGRGAGDLPTGSAIVSDIVFAAKQNKHGYTSFKNTNEVSDKGFSKNFVCNYYIRMTVEDEAGVLAKISGVFGKNNVSINTMIQEENGETAKLIFLMHKTEENNIMKSLKAIEALECVEKVDALIRVEE